jgi:hypothetical protein
VNNTFGDRRPFIGPGMIISVNSRSSGLQFDQSSASGLDGVVQGLVPCLAIPPIQDHRMLRTPFIETLSDLFIRSAGWRGRDELFVDEIDRISGADALDQALRIAQGFADHGAAPGQLIAYLCRSSARHAVAWFAAPLSGRIACSLHVRETPERLGHALDWLDAKILAGV